MIKVPYQQLSEEALIGVIESYVLREGTEYGTQPVSLKRKVAQVMDQLQRGTAVIFFDPTTESVNIMTVTDHEQSS